MQINGLIFNTYFYKINKYTLLMYKLILKFNFYSNNLKFNFYSNNLKFNFYSNNLKFADKTLLRFELYYKYIYWYYVHFFSNHSSIYWEPGLSFETLQASLNWYFQKLSKFNLSLSEKNFNNFFFFENKSKEFLSPQNINFFYSYYKKNNDVFSFFLIKSILSFVLVNVEFLSHLKNKLNFNLFYKQSYKKKIYVFHPQKKYKLNK